MLTVSVLKSLETPSLVVREMRKADASELACFMTQSRYQRFISHRLKDEAAVREFLLRQVAIQGDFRRHIFHLAAEERFSGEVVGDGFLIVHPDKAVEIGWGLHPALWRAGLGTEIGSALLAMAFERLSAERVWCKVMKPNIASARLAAHIGMTCFDSRTDFPVGHGRLEAVDFFELTVHTYHVRTY